MNSDVHDDRTFRTLFDRSPFSIAIATPDGRFIDVNEAFVKMLGYTHEEALGMTFLDITHEEDRSESARLVDEIRQGGRTSYRLEKRYVRKSGALIWGRVTVSAICDEAGTIDCWLGIMEDITERMRTEEVRDSWHETINTILDSIDADVYVADMYTYEVLYMNKKMQDDFNGYYLGEKCWSVFTEREAPCDDCSNGRLLDSEGNPAGVYAWEGYNGRAGKWCMNYDRAIKWLDGRYVRLHVATDITDLKRMERELQRTEKLESLGVLAGGIAHDFNNLLSAVLGNISLAKLEIDQADDVADILDEAERATRRATALTKQLLTFSRGGAPVKKLASVADIVRESAGFARRGWDCGFSLTTDPDLWHAEVDDGQISHAIHNIVLNAGQALGGSGSITVRAENALASADTPSALSAGKYVRIVISDDGPGISPKALPKIFDPYFSTRNGGSGLGLTTAYSIVKQHRGEITVESTLGKGTTFTMYLPASEQLPLDLGFEEQDMHRAIDTSARVLFMDDEEMNRNVVSRMLSKLGYLPESVADGREAVEVYKAALESDKPFSAVILDLTVPEGIGGVKAVKQLSEINPDVLAIVTSGYSTDPVMAHYRDYGFSGRIEKPFKTADLKRVLTSVLSGSFSAQ